MVRKTKFFGFCVEMSSFIAKLSAATWKKLIVNYEQIVENEDLLIKLLIHGKSIV